MSYQGVDRIYDALAGRPRRLHENQLQQRIIQENQAASGVCEKISLHVKDIV